jgi:hypothetical protein
VAVRRSRYRFSRAAKGFFFPMFHLSSMLHKGQYFLQYSKDMHADLMTLGAGGTQYGLSGDFHSCGSHVSFYSHFNEDLKCQSWQIVPVCAELRGGLYSNYIYSNHKFVLLASYSPKYR